MKNFTLLSFVFSCGHSVFFQKSVCSFYFSPCIIIIIIIVVVIYKVATLQFVLYGCETWSVSDFKTES